MGTPTRNPRLSGGISATRSVSKEGFSNRISAGRRSSAFDKRPPGSNLGYVPISRRYESDKLDILDNDDGYPF